MRNPEIPPHRSVRALTLTLPLHRHGLCIPHLGFPIFENYMHLVMYSFGFEVDWTRRGMFFAEEGMYRMVADRCDVWMAELACVSLASVCRLRWRS
jgi:hypothetical protein